MNIPPEVANAIITIIPTLTTIFATINQNRLSKKHAAKQSILQMILEDQLSWELFRKFPVNYGNIQDEYAIYHKCGGNGEVTKKVEDYKVWYKANEDKMLEMIQRSTFEDSKKSKNRSTNMATIAK